jgi:osmotically-inducible protein OsmY
MVSLAREDLATLPEDRADDEIVQDVLGALGGEEIPRTDLAALHVEAHLGTLVLRGYVRSRVNRTRAEEIARGVRGVLAVCDRLIADEDFQIAVAPALGMDARTRDQVIRVEAGHGVVRLVSATRSEGAGEATEEIAGSVPGVRAVAAGGPARTSEHILLPRIGTPVYTEEGELGRLHRVVLDPHSRQVTHLVVERHVPPTEDTVADTEHRPAPGDVLVPLAPVDHATDAGLFLRLGRGAIAALAPYYDADFVVPAATWVPSFDYRREDVRLARGPVPSASVSAARLAVGETGRVAVSSASDDHR